MNKAATVFAKYSETSKGELAFGAGVVGTGVHQIQRAHRSGSLTGRETVYHTTKAKNVKSIKAKGLQHIFSTDPSNITNMALQDVPMDLKKGKVYMARSKTMGRIMRPQGRLVGTPLETLKLRIPLADVARHETVNPELRGATSKGQFRQRAFRAIYRNRPDWASTMDDSGPIIKNLTYRSGGIGYSLYSKKSTLTYQGNVGPENVVGSAKYKATTLQDIFSHVKTRPGMFAKGVARTALGAALVAAPFVVSKIKKSRTKGS